MNFTLTDEKGFAAHAQAVTEAAWRIVAERGEVTSRELGAALYRQGIGDAKSEDRYELSYSSTGAIARAGLNHLWSNRLLAYLDTPSGTTFMFMGKETRAIHVSLVPTLAGREYMAQREHLDGCAAGELRRDMAPC